MKRARLRLTLVLASVVLALTGIEVAVRATQLDIEMIARVLYYQNADAPVHAVSDDVVLHYELAPNTHFSARVDDSSYRVSIGEHGARGSTRLEKEPGTFRILFFGGSTVYGHGIDDDQTIPSRLDHHLGDRVEVWNFGTSAYVEAQMARKAQRELARIPEVDLVLMMVTNSGRRAFIPTDDPEVHRRYVEMLAAEPYGWLENFSPPLDSVNPAVVRVHDAMMGWSAAWRYWRATELARSQAPPPRTWSNALAQRERERLDEQAARLQIPTLYVSYPDDPRQPTPPPLGVPESKSIDLWRPEQPPEFYDPHPPPDVLDQHAERIATLLKSGSHLPAVSQ